jgi:adenine-specific DNA-methyltransferase
VELRTKVFEAAEVGDSILFFGSARHPTSKSKLQYLVVEHVTPGSELISTQSNHQSELAASIGARFRSSSIIIKSAQKTLGELWEVSNGLNPGNVKHILLSDSKLSSKHKKMLRGRDIQRYLLKWSGTWVNFDPDLKERIKPSETRSKKGMTAQQRVDFALRSPEIYKPNKVMVRKTADRIVACFDPDGLCFDSLSYGIQAKSNRFNAKFLLGLLNSKFLGYIHAELSQNQEKIFAKVLAENIRRLPMPELNHQLTDDRKKHDAIVALVDRILAAKKRNPDADTSALEREIDQLAYALYGLTPEEIQIVEGAAK